MIYREGYWWPLGTEDYYHRYIRHGKDSDRAIKYCRGRNTVIQAGGHVGVWPMHLSGTFRHVITFEPEPANLECLLKNTAGIDKIEVVHGLLARQDGEAGLKVSAKNSGGHYLQRDGEGIPAFSIDGLGVTHLDALILDIEGAELDALQGAEDTIELCNPVIMLEMNEKAEKTGLCTREAIRAWLSDHGYKQVDAIARDVVFAR